MALAAVTGGEVRSATRRPATCVMIRSSFRRLGLRSRSTATTCVVPPGQELRRPDRPRRRDPEDRGRPLAGLPGRPHLDRARPRHPGARATILIFEKMFENRLFFVDKLVAMGARITLCDPHRAIVSGPRRLHGERVESPDIRAGMAMLIAALCAEGTSEIGNIAPDRPRLRADRRAAARTRCPD